jgi:hypothetical protein
MFFINVLNIQNIAAETDLFYYLYINNCIELSDKTVSDVVNC